MPSDVGIGLQAQPTIEVPSVALQAQPELPLGQEPSLLRRRDPSDLSDLSGLGKFGLVLSNVGAGLRGQRGPSPVQRLIAQRTALQRQQRDQLIEDRSLAQTEGRSAQLRASTLPEDQRASFLAAESDRLGEQFGPVAKQEFDRATGGEATSLAMENIADAIELDTTLAEAALRGDGEAFDKRRMSPEFSQLVVENIAKQDQAQFQLIADKLRSIGGFLKEFHPDILKRIDSDGVRTIAELREINALVPSDIRLTDKDDENEPFGGQGGEIGVVGRNAVFFDIAGKKLLEFKQREEVKADLKTPSLSDAETRRARLKASGVSEQDLLDIDLSRLKNPRVESFLDAFFKSLLGDESTGEPAEAAEPQARELSEEEQAVQAKLTEPWVVTGTNDDGSFDVENTVTGETGKMRPE